MNFLIQLLALHQILKHGFRLIKKQKQKDFSKGEKIKNKEKVLLLEMTLLLIKLLDNLLTFSSS